MSSASEHDRHRRPSLTSSDVPRHDDRPSPSAQGDQTTPTEEGRQNEFPGLTADEEAAGDDGKTEQAASQGTQGGQPPSKLHRTLRLLAILGLLTNAAIWGTLTREGLIALNTYDGRSIQPVIWAQAVGCLVM